MKNKCKDGEISYYHNRIAQGVANPSANDINHNMNNVNNVNNPNKNVQQWSQIRQQQQ